MKRTRIGFFALAAGLLFLGAASFGAGRLREAGRLAAQPAERAATPEGMVYVPGGWCLLGTDDPDAEDDQKPQRRVWVPSFYIDRTEVTNQAFQKFKPTYAYSKGKGNLPATAITYDEAEAYAAWAGKQVPTGDQWEKAARGADGRRYPWGNKWDPARVARRGVTLGVKPDPALLHKPSNACVLSPPRVQPVGGIPSGASPYGCLDMAGNAWEWVQGFYGGNPNQRLLRGGAVGYKEQACRTYAYAVEGSMSTCNDTGFRCARPI